MLAIWVYGANLSSVFITKDTCAYGVTGEITGALTGKLPGA